MKYLALFSTVLMAFCSVVFWAAGLITEAAVGSFVTGFYLFITIEGFIQEAKK